LRCIALITLLVPTLLNAGIQQGTEVTRALQSAASVYDIPFPLLKAICFVESSLESKAYNKYDGNSPSYGLCQIKGSTARSLGFKGPYVKLFNSYINAGYAAKYLRYQLDRYNQDVLRAVSAYNRGSAPLPIRNRKYVKKVMQYYLRFS